VVESPAVAVLAVVAAAAVAIIVTVVAGVAVAVVASSTVAVARFIKQHIVNKSSPPSSHCPVSAKSRGLGETSGGVRGGRRPL